MLPTVQLHRIAEFQHRMIISYENRVVAEFLEPIMTERLYRMDRV